MFDMEASSLCVRYLENARQIAVFDKRNGKQWIHAPFSDSLGEVTFSASSGFLRFSFKALPGVELLIFQDRDAELVYTLHGDTALPIDEIALPPAIVPPDDDCFILQTDSEGMLLPVNDTGYPLSKEPVFRCSGGPCMAWMGMVDREIRSGFMQIYETPYDACVELKKNDGRIGFFPVWQSSMGKFGYDRKVRFVFFSDGGYVAQCKRYREFSWPFFKAVSLRDKVAAFPEMDKMMGAVHMYVWDNARTAAFLEDLKASGVERAMLLWDPNHPPYPDEAYVAAAKKLGFAAGNYTLFTDTHPDQPIHAERLKQLPLLGNIYPGRFDEITAKTKTGGTYSNVFGNFVCPAAIRSEIIKRIDQMCAQYRDETFFLDVYMANGLYECYDPRHPLTREGYAKAMLDNMRYIRDTYGAYSGSEFGADYGVGEAAYVHGMMTLQRTWFDSITTIPGSIYYTGDWYDPARPSSMLGIRTASPDYHRYSLNAYLRVPLYELVYHDAVVTSWRWEDCNYHNPEIWWKKDLFNMLYGSAPLWSLDHDRFHEFKTTFRSSYEKIIPWLRLICYDELISHRFVTPDHLVQESIFSSGRKILVNFGDCAAEVEQAVVPPRDAIWFDA